MKFEYKLGSVLEQRGILAHACNTERTMGSGIALAIARRWPVVETTYIEHLDAIAQEAGSTSYRRKALGTVSVATITEDTCVVNMITQLLGRFHFAQKTSPTSLDAVHNALLQLRAVWQQAPNPKPSIHMPLIAAVRGGVDWTITRAILDSVFRDTDAHLCVWILPTEYETLTRQNPHWQLTVDQHGFFE